MEWIPSDVVEHTPEVLIHQPISIPLGLYSPFASGQLPAASELNVSTNLWGLDQGFSGDYVQHSADTGVERGTQDLMEIGDNDVAFGYTGTMTIKNFLFAYFPNSMLGYYTSISNLKETATEA